MEWYWNWFGKLKEMGTKYSPTVTSPRRNSSVIYTTRRRCHIICPKHLQLKDEIVSRIGGNPGLCFGRIEERYRYTHIPPVEGNSQGR
jgi:hypothetical protein